MAIYTQYCSFFNCLFVLNKIYTQNLPFICIPILGELVIIITLSILAEIFYLNIYMCAWLVALFFFFFEINEWHRSTTSLGWSGLQVFLTKHYRNRRLGDPEFVLDFEEIYVIDSRTKSITRAKVLVRKFPLNISL